MELLNSVKIYINIIALSYAWCTLYKTWVALFNKYCKVFEMLKTFVDEKKVLEYSKKNSPS